MLETVRYMVGEHDCGGTNPHAKYNIGRTDPMWTHTWEKDEVANIPVAALSIKKTTAG